jgi:hypothetical protein
MVEVIKKKCNVTGKVISGLGRDEFEEKWNKHLESLNGKEGIAEDEEVEIEYEELEKKSIDELKSLANEIDVDIKKSWNKKKIIDAIWDSLE